MSPSLITGLPLFKRGKVRDIYVVGDHLLMVATDRISCFDVVLPTEIPGKGKILTSLSLHWFGVMEDIASNHLLATDVAKFPPVCHRYRDRLEGRSMLVKKATPAPVECIVRGYLFGSAWKEYGSNGSVCGISLPKGLVEGARLEKPLFTPSTKAPVGEHDENITFAQMVDRVGKKRAEKMRDISIAVYLRAREMAEARGIIIADTKLEFGMIDGEVILIDELLTPDSSRFWPREGYQPGKSPGSFDKQYVRDYLLSLNWDMKPPAPLLPPEIVRKTQEKYAEALRRLTAPPA
ncbi:MAG: phosphoribosylaminoimidazolesuccinocarboxamide synthase [Deltaproteobacteria bacterium RIFCSPLOWO2_12_55_13]|nr:MAG: phosphoribosylaminoimidazolesuccinocarboxamide synthase [Deltaproteobacteria bacterium GWD2_55_8]OGQ66475.1 MAG: phosphoribosylaminoimidazolesuccinocarboxamide synthase [Deltaproteobacteria bacterium RIFCSPLOWO2_12_55_13]OGQ93073.1 MAG: phosphoribosylaminoimidazolesuccinocarboxamide synthase [Deltaproteobacteria bacterium RIFOXYA2_FULL_55_11]HBA39206.1 phosphoribosylaminoimidazolesuccinocarboxamide synthase [Deltaproteobacteria bacterium]